MITGCKKRANWLCSHRESLENTLGTKFGSEGVLCCTFCESCVGCGGDSDSDTGMMAVKHFFVCNRCGESVCMHYANIGCGFHYFPKKIGLICELLLLTTHYILFIIVQETKLLYYILCYPCFVRCKRYSG